jgi:dsDNA-specific endonuclease/ATPase MutS2
MWFDLDFALLYQTEEVSEDEIVELPITSVFDLHTVPPRDVKEVVEAYLEAAWEKGLTELRIIHGKGIGVQREAVRKVLERTAFVESFRTAPEEAGGWGATLVTLRPVKLKER